MRTAEELFKDGRLNECLATLQSEIRRKPAEAKLRTFLAQLLMVMGDWDRALNQLNVLAELDASALPMKHAYATAIQCEQLRSAVFAGAKTPLILGNPEPWIAGLVEALAIQAKGLADQAAAIRAHALEEAPTTAGTINGTAFEWIADADSRLGPVLEMLLHGAYYWVPFARIRRIAFEKPTDIRDLIWIPAHITWSNEGEAMALVPVRYAGSEHSDEDAVKLSRKTEWRELGVNSFSGLGHRVLATSDEEFDLLQVRDIVLESGV